MWEMLEKDKSAWLFGGLVLMWDFIILALLIGFSIGWGFMALLNHRENIKKGMG